MGTRPAREHLPTAVMAVGELSSLTLLAPLEYQTGQYVGLPDATAWTITGIVYAVTVLAILTGRLIPAAFALVWLSGVVGVLHSASEAAKRSGEALDQTRAATSIAVVTIVVLAMAAAWWLAREWHRRADERRVEVQTQARTEEDARAVRREREAETRRAHELETMRLQQAGAREAFDAELEAARAAHVAELRDVRAQLDVVRTTADRAAHDLETARDRARALEVDLSTARALLEEQRTAARSGAARQRTAGARRPARANPAAPVREAAQADDLAVRRRVRAQWAAREAAGRVTPTRALARTLGVGDGAARAQVSRWKAERAGAADGDVRDQAVAE